MGLPKLASVLEHVPPNSELHVQFEELSYIDHGGSNPLGSPNVTGYQFPRAVVEALAVHVPRSS